VILSCECNELVLNNVAVESNPLLRIRKHCATFEELSTSMCLWSLAGTLLTQPNG